MSPETLSVRRSNFLQVRQKDGEAFVSFLSRARAALVDTNYRHPCIHATPPSKNCGIDGCPSEGASYGEDQLRDVLISSLADREVRRAVHAKPGIVAVPSAFISSQTLLLCPPGVKMSGELGREVCGTPGTPSYRQRQPDDVLGGGMCLMISKDGLHWSLFT